MQAIHPHTRRNVISLAGDSIMFYIGFALFDPTVLIPAFAKELSGSSFLVGALSGTRMLMITLPQIVAASVLLNSARKKPLLAYSSLGGRLPVLFLAVAVLLWAKSRPGLVIAALVLTIALFYISEGLNSISWPDLIGKVIPPEIRGRFLGLSQMAGSMISIAAGWVVRRVLGQVGPSFPQNWALLFGLAFLFFMLSLLAITIVHEKPDTVKKEPTHIGHAIRLLARHVRDDVRLRRLVLLQIVLGMASTVSPFVVLRARELLPQGDEALAVFLVMQNLGGVTSALVCGYLIDHVGSRAAIRVNVILQSLALTSVVVAGLLHGVYGLYLLTFFALGFVAGSSWWTFTSYLIDLSTPENRPTYLAASGILTSPLVLVSLLVGGLYDLLSPEILFASALAVVLIGFGLAMSLADVRPTNGTSAAPTLDAGAAGGGG